MPFITTAESIGIEKGIKKGALKTTGEAVIAVLETRFGFVHEETVKAIKEIKKIDILKGLLRKAITVNSLEEFDGLLLEFKE